MLLYAFFLLEDPKLQTQTKVKKQSDEIVIQASRAPNRADAQVHDIKADPENANLNLSEVLNKLPSVNVDSEGNLSLRGNNNVKILIDGRETIMTAEQNRALLLQTTSGQAIDSIEIMTNPSSRFSSEGSGGVINIITKKNAQIGSFGTLRASKYNNGGYSNGLVANYAKNGLSINLNIENRTSESNNNSFLTRREIDNAFMSSSDAKSTNYAEAEIFSLAINYRIIEKHLFGLEFNDNSRINNYLSASDIEYNNFTNNYNSIYSRYNSGTTYKDETGLKAFYEYKIAKNEKLKFELLNSKTNEKYFYNSETQYFLPNQNKNISKNTRPLNNEKTQLTGDYYGNFWGGDFKIGFNLSDETLAQSTIYESKIGDVFIVNQNLSNDFKIQTDIRALYATKDFSLSPKWALAIGLRSEDWQYIISPNAKTNGAQNRFNNFSQNMHFTNFLNERNKLRFSYSNRFQAPNVRDLNPLIIYRDHENWSSGNAFLMHEKAFVSEIAWEHKLANGNLNSKLFINKSKGVIANSYLLLNENLILTTKDNLGKSQQSGLDINYSAFYKKKLRTNLNLVLRNSKFEGVLGQFPFNDDINSISAKLYMSYIIDKKRNFSINISNNGKQLSFLETKSNGTNSSFNYSHKLNDKLTIMASAQNPLRLQAYNIQRRNYFVNEDFSWHDKNTIYQISINYRFKIK
jgi:outer membrane receptor for ferrienterochelin and colicin